ncbi:hypothetical protein CAPTEDRAFT_195781 [Capitella teleta]|uniref:Uncharacterized protein n=1 Tax=Capitella teleta TaxID=283909 RepID=R7THD4_CAPTE|nr:hypothetical protein CAPTEDRAFT_195781 [Capitella teleta]|eukprot:ELT93129.1 hypothetical protein CAPTEDRAFT_195781 [Capitella teleta]
MARYLTLSPTICSVLMGSSLIQRHEQSEIKDTRGEARKQLRDAVKDLRVVVGTEKGTVLKGCRPTKQLFVNRLERCSTDTVKKYMISKGVTPRDVHCTSKESWLNASFRLTVVATDMDRVFDAHFWPVGVRCREWLPNASNKRRASVSTCDDPQDDPLRRITLEWKTPKIMITPLMTPPLMTPSLMTPPLMTPLMMWTTITAMDSCTRLRLITWNFRGHRMDRMEYIHTLMCRCDVLFIQEHWFLDADICKISEHVDNVEVIGVSGMDDSRLISVPAMMLIGVYSPVQAQ